MKPCYIHSIASISAQETLNSDLFLRNVIEHESNMISAIRPNYKDFISPVASRRMATGVKMGVVTAKTALKEGGITQPDAIITGTGMGCIEDSEKFLNTIINNDEEYLTPTSFIQSTHNTVGAQIALGLECKSYNVTYVHGANSFEFALLDAQLMLHEATANTILVGGVDELGKKFITDYALLHDTQKVPFSEGAHFFTVTSEKQENSYATLQAVSCIQSIAVEEISSRVRDFLKNNNLSASDIDVVVLGNNGDEYDMYYSRLQDSLFKNALQLEYKHLCGEYYTASAFGLWGASKVMRNQIVPDALRINTIKKSQYKTILLYNQYKGEHHSFILLTAC
ncbi:beta-ketoacyl synthase chain length factor [Aquimarina sediminis]|uniref:beta-ketoacyl synthase chain length factor n=1 Tax=Aquimarina sediminis TaxID=2070536 RepID=UPI000CA06F4B|nr:beta-ketoacyl synthase chain length factor [Aquimarina sediminis]